MMYNRGMEMTVSKMTVNDLKQLISDVFDEKLSQIVDPDAGLEVRDELRQLLLEQSERVRNGERGSSLEEVMTELGLDTTDLQPEKDDVQATIS